MYFLLCLANTEKGLEPNCHPAFSLEKNWVLSLACLGCQFTKNKTLVYSNKVVQYKEAFW